jgi:DNA-binding XRE family transcriptional regulator
METCIGCDRPYLRLPPYDPNIPPECAKCRETRLAREISTEDLAAILAACRKAMAALESGTTIHPDDHASHRAYAILAAAVRKATREEG